VITESPRRKKKLMFILNIISLLLARISRRRLTDNMVGSILYNTPPKHRGSKRFFRNLEDSGKTSNIFSIFLYLFI